MPPAAPVLTVLGAAPAGDAARLAALFADEGLVVTVRRAAGIAAFAAHGAAWRRDRAVLRAGLSRAAAAAPFLPADPRFSLCGAAEWRSMVEASAASLAASLADAGQGQQWEIRVVPHASDASPASVLAALRSALDGRAAGFRVTGRGGALKLLVLLPRGEGAALGRAIGGLAPPLRARQAIMVEGPLPPFAFAAFRVAEAEAEMVARAWALLALKDVADPAELARRWRCLAFALDPARAGRGASRGSLAEAERAYGLLRALSDGVGQDRFARGDLLARCGMRLALPAGLSGGSLMGQGAAACGRWGRA